MGVMGVELVDEALNKPSEYTSSKDSRLGIVPSDEEGRDDGSTLDGLPDIEDDTVAMMSALQKRNEKLERQVKEFKKHLMKHKKLGLKWENQAENVMDECAVKVPILEEVPERAILEATYPDSPTHFIIEGDNYYSLLTLNATHTGKIDIIYIDPPYNTGKAAKDGETEDENKTDFIYNDDYVEKDDLYRHSKWLSFMSKRLQLAWDLLNDRGTIFISIDDNELFELKVLCDKVFQPQNFICNMVRQSASGGGNAKTIVKGHDYILCYTKDSELILTQKSNRAEGHIQKWESGKHQDKYIVRNNRLYFLNNGNCSGLVAATG